MGKVIMSGLVNELTAPVKPLMLGDVAEGQIITIKESNNPVEFYVAKHNYEEGLNGKGRTLVVRKDCIINYDWSAKRINEYYESDIDKWLNSDYFNMLGSSVQVYAIATKFSYTIGNGNWTVATLERPIFALSLTELGLSHSTANVEGTALPISGLLKIAKLEGRNNEQWTRTPATNTNSDAYYLRTDGGLNYDKTSLSYGIRPIFTLPATTKLNPDRSVIE